MLSRGLERIVYIVEMRLGCGSAIGSAKYVIRLFQLRVVSCKTMDKTGAIINPFRDTLENATTAN